MRLEQIKELMHVLQNLEGRVEVWVNVKPGAVLKLVDEMTREYGPVLREADSAVSVVMTGGYLLVKMGDMEFYFKES